LPGNHAVRGVDVDGLASLGTERDTTASHAASGRFGRERGARGSLWLFVGATSNCSRVLIGAVVVLAIAARMAVLGTALAIGREDGQAAIATGVAAALLFGVGRLIQGPARVAVECDLHMATVRAILEGDVLDVAAADTQRVVFEGNHRTVELLSSVVPSLLADGLGTLLMAPLLVSVFSGRVLLIALLVLSIITVVAITLRRFTRVLQTRLSDAYQNVGDAVLVAIEGTVEVVAAGMEAPVIDNLERNLRAYRRLATRSAWLSALLGRAPIAAGLLAIAVVAGIDASSREALATAIVARALVLAAVMPSVVGAVLSAHAVTRAVALSGPFANVLSSPARRDALRVGIGAPILPAPIDAKALEFSYARSAPSVFRDLSYHWPVGEPLVIVGPNGSGKSTLLRLLIGLRAPTDGFVHVDGRDLEQVDVRALRRQVAYLPQRPYLGEPYASLRSVLGPLRGGRNVDDDAMRRALARAHLANAKRGRGEDILDLRLGELSSGQRQRVALARMLLQNARMVLLDEPDANLDQEGIALVAALVSELTAAGTMVAIAAHTPQLAALSKRTITLGETPAFPPVDG
jgi:ABC-type bacteriocin/lantibiotic exporter with double-glycine peptidase domain